LWAAVHFAGHSRGEFTSWRMFREYWKCLLTRKKGDLYVFKADVTVKAPAEIYIPSVQYPHGVTVTVDGGRFEKVKDCILVYTENSGMCTVKISKQ
jgi:hypothetical protein